jgi:hypothetical protein
MWQFIKELWALQIERSKVHKAMRLLSKQEWSVEFLTALLVRASKLQRQQLEMELVSANGHKIIIRSTDGSPQTLPDEDIFNHLDDDVKIRSFINRMSK